MDGSWKASALGALVGVVFALAGCGEAPLAPEGSAGGTSFSSVAPPVVAFAPDGSTDYVWAPLDTIDATLTEPLDPSLHPRSLIVSEEIDGGLGGVVHVGRFTLDIPADAFSGKATVTLSIPDSTVVLCDLSISPLSANAFKVPVKLTADLSSVDLMDASICTMYWYDPNRLSWLNLSTKSRTSGTLVTTSLDHFSRYAAGKAGW